MAKLDYLFSCESNRPVNFLASHVNSGMTVQAEVTLGEKKCIKVCMVDTTGQKIGKQGGSNMECFILFKILKILNGREMLSKLNLFHKLFIFIQMFEMVLIVFDQ